MRVAALKKVVGGAAILIAALVFIFISCSRGEGALKVTTSPIPVTISINGLPYGTSPLTVSLSAGTYEISFPGEGSQFETPETRSIAVEAGTTQTVHAVYRNRFIDEAPAPGFTLADSVRYYGTRERILADGVIFDYLNSGANAYLAHGLRRTTHALYRSVGGSELVLDIFDMGVRDNAEEAIADPEICPADFDPCGIGAECRTYSYPPDFLMYFQKGPFLVFLSTNNDSLAGEVKTIAGSVAARIK